MFVGGEFYFDRLWITDRRAFSTDGMYFLNGGTACLIVIGEYLIDHGIRKMLLPSYLCPSIVATLERSGMECDYYQVNRDLSLDVEDLSGKLTRGQAVYFINYFGFLHPPIVQDFMCDLRQKGVIVVEDNAQAGFLTSSTGDFIFNSMRKLVPYDGGYLITHYNMQPYMQKYENRANNRLPLIREYRQKLYSYLVDGDGSYDELVKLFTQSEQLYSEDLVILGDQHEKEQIEYLDWEGIKQARRQNYLYMLVMIKNIPEITPIFPSLQEGMMPLGLPVYFSGVSRNQVNEELGKAEIGLCIHWDDLLNNPRTNRNATAVDMANSMLTLTIDQRTNRDQMDYLAWKLSERIAVVKSGMSH